MDKIRYDFDQASRQISQIHRLLEDAQDCVEQARRARTDMMDLGDRETVRLLTDVMDARIREGRKICDRLESLERALRSNLQRFEEMEAELTRGIQGIGVVRISDYMDGQGPLLSREECVIGESRFGDLIYPDFLSEAADKYFASTL